MREEERRTKGKLYNPSKLHDSAWIEAKAAMEDFNRCGIRDMAKAGSILKQVFSEYGDHSMIIPPLYYSQGRNIFIGASFFANTGLVILDDGDVRIGEHVYMGPNVSIYTAAHPVDSTIRNTGLQCVHGVTIGNNVWIGGSVTINPGVTIGDETVIGSGSVVTKSIPSGVIAAGNPCRVLREINDADRKYWKAEYQDYLGDPDVRQKRTGNTGKKVKKMMISDEKRMELKGKGFIPSKDGEHFAARILTGNGTATSDQLRALADAADRFGRGTVSFTSRLSVELPGVSEDNTEPLSAFLKAHDLETGGTGAKIRPITCCKGTVCVHGLIDTQKLAQELHERYYKGWHDISLPAKFKIAVGGCPNNCAKPSLNDFGISGWTRIDEQGKRIPAYKITIGGIWGKTQRIGTPIEGVFTKEQVFAILDQTIAIWMKEANPKERFGRYLDRIGVEEFLSRLDR